MLLVNKLTVMPSGRRLKLIRLLFTLKQTLMANGCFALHWVDNTHNYSQITCIVTKIEGIPYCRTSVVREAGLGATLLAHQHTTTNPPPAVPKSFTTFSLFHFLSRSA